MEPERGAEGSPGGDGPSKTSTFLSAGQLAGLGFQFAFAILLGLFAGRWLDRMIGTAPLFLFVGVFLGAGAAMYSMYQRLRAVERKEDESRRK